MESKIVVLIVIAMLSQCKGGSVPDSIQELQRLFGDGTSNDEYSNAYYEVLLHAQGLRKQAANQLKSHLTGNDMYGFDEDHIEEFVKNMKLISQTKVETEQDIEVLRNQLYNSEDFQTELMMEQLLYNRDDSEEAQAAFDEVFLKFNANSVVQLYYTDDQDIFSGVIIAAKRKNSPRAVYLVFVMD